MAKGYKGAKSKVFRRANEAVVRALQYSYRGRGSQNLDFRRLWITRINAAARMNSISYSRYISGLQKAGVTINIKVLADLAVNKQESFEELGKIARDGLDNA